MGIYINMDMPTEGPITIKIGQDGTVYKEEGVFGITRSIAKAIDVPPHGRLIDTSAKVKTQIYDDEHEEWSDEVEMTVEEFLGYCFNEVPTIIPAEE